MNIAVISVLLGIAAAIGQNLPPPATPTLEYRVLVLNNKTGKPEQNWYVMNAWPYRGGTYTDHSGIAVLTYFNDDPPKQEYVSEWSHEKFCANRTFSVAEILRNGVVASGDCDNHEISAPNPAPGVLVLFARSLNVGERFRIWWAAHVFPGP
jgi:hypothetical protein